MYVDINMHVDGLAADTWMHTKFHNYGMRAAMSYVVGLLQHKKAERERERETSSKGFASSKGSMNVNLYKNTYFLFIQCENIIAGIFGAKTSIFRAKQF